MGKGHGLHMALVSASEQLIGTELVADIGEQTHVPFSLAHLLKKYLPLLVR